MASPLFGLADKRQERAFWTVFSGFGLDALNIQIYAFVLPVLLAAWGISHAQGGLLATAALVGSAFGGWGVGILADRFGRVHMMKLTILWFSIATCICGLTNTFEQMLLARFVQGLGFGGELAVCAVFLGEVAPAHARARLVGLAQSGWSLGWSAAAVISLAVLSKFQYEHAWRLMFFVGLIPAAIIYIFRSKLSEPEIFVSARGSDHQRLSWRAIFSDGTWRATAKGSLLAIGVHGGYWGIATWWPAMLLSERGLTLIGSGPYLAALIAGSFVGYVVGACLADKVGRRLTLASFALSGILLVLVYSQLPVSNMPFLLLSFPLGFVATGMYGTIGSTLVELFPTALRGAGMGFCYNCGRGVAGFSPAVIGWAAATFGVGNAIALFVVVAYGMVLLAVLLLSETRGKELGAQHQSS